MTLLCERCIEEKIELTPEEAYKIFGSDSMLSIACDDCVDAKNVNNCTHGIVIIKCPFTAEGKINNNCKYIC